jgi:hypothetical protein
MTPMCFWFMVCASYFPRGCRSKIVSTLQQFRIEKPATLTTIIGPLYQLLSKKKPSEGCRVKGRPRSNLVEEGSSTIPEQTSTRGKRPDRSDSQIIGDLYQLLADKKTDKKQKFKLQYTIRDDVFLNSCKSTLLRLDQKESSAIEHLAEKPAEGKAASNFETKRGILQSRRKTQLSKMIQHLEEELEDQKTETDNSIKRLKKEIEKEHNMELPFEGTYQPDHLLKDLQCRFEEEIRFLDHMEYKQHNMVISNIFESMHHKDKFVFPEKERPKKSEDYCCQVCSDGDYTESNQIVFCARCNISFHQRCYGISPIPEGNWICDLCKYHGAEGRFMRCALCTRKGGCLRRVNIEARSEFWKQRNPTYYESMISHPCQEEEIPVPIPDAELADDVSVNSKNFESYLFYDYYTELDKHRPEDIAREPHPFLTWVHLSCCLWNTELEVQMYQNPPEKVQGFDKMEKKRFGLTCSVCGQKDGACVQCASRKCHEAFHVECARRTKVFMEAKNSDNRHYTVYCDRHAPLMAKRKLDSSALSLCSDITKFCKNIEKIFDTHRHSLEEKPLEEETPGFIRSLKKKKMERNEANSFEEYLLKNFFIREVKHEIVKFPDFGNVINIKCSPEGEPQVAEYEPPKKVFLKSAIHKHHKVWSQLAKKNNWQLRNIYKKYKRILQGVTEGPLDSLLKIKAFKKSKDDCEGVGDVFFFENTERSLDSLRIRQRTVLCLPKALERGDHDR